MLARCRQMCYKARGRYRAPGGPTVVAYVLITTATGKESHVLGEMRKLPELGEVHQLFGQFDMIARIESKDYDALCDIVLDKIRTIPGVTSTKTLITARFKRQS